MATIDAVPSLGGMGQITCVASHRISFPHTLYLVEARE